MNNQKRIGVKELSIEEKAKAYDKALAHAKLLLKTIGNATLGNLVLKNEFERMFSELKESEDDEIRKWIRKELESKYVVDNIVNNVMADKALAWLEKQSDKELITCPICGWEIEKQVEQKPVMIQLKFKIGDVIKRRNSSVTYTVTKIDTSCFQLDGGHWLELDRMSEFELVDEKTADTVEPKFKVGDWITFNRPDSSKEIFYIYAIRDNRYYFNDNIHFSWSVKECDEKCHLWTIQDAKDGDILCDYLEEYNNPLIFILKKFERVYFGLVKPSDYSSYCFLTAGDRQMFKEGKYHHKHNIKPATNEQRDLLFKKMHEAGYEWDADKKELKKIEKSSTIKQSI